MIDIIENLVQTAGQGEIRAYLIKFLDQKDLEDLMATQGFDTWTLEQEFKLRKPHQDCSSWELVNRFRLENGLGDCDPATKESLYDRLYLRCHAA